MRSVVSFHRSMNHVLLKPRPMAGKTHDESTPAPAKYYFNHVFPQSTDDIAFANHLKTKLESADGLHAATSQSSHHPLVRVVVFYGPQQSGKSHSMRTLANLLHCSSAPLPLLHISNAAKLNSSYNTPLEDIHHAWTLWRLSPLQSQHPLIAVELHPLLCRSQDSKKRFPTDPSPSQGQPPSLPAPPTMTQSHSDSARASLAHSWNTFFKDLSNPKSFLRTCIWHLVTHQSQSLLATKLEAFNYSLLCVACCESHPAHRPLTECTLEFSQRFNFHTKQSIVKAIKSDCKLVRRDSLNKLLQHSQQHSTLVRQVKTLQEKVGQLTSHVHEKDKSIQSLINQQTASHPPNTQPPHEVSPQPNSNKHPHLTLSSTEHVPHSDLLAHLQHEHLQLQQETLSKIHEFEQLQQHSQHEYSTLKERLSLLQEEAQQSAALVETLTHDKETLQSTVQLLEESLHGNEFTLLRTQQQLRDLTLTHTQLQAVHQASKEEVLRLNSFFEFWEQQYATLLKQIEAKTVLIKELQDRVDNLRRKLAANKPSVQDQKEIIDAQEKDLITMRGQLESLSAELNTSKEEANLRETSLKDEQSEMRHTLNSTQKKLQELEMDKKDKDSLVLLLKHDLQEANSKLRRIEKEKQSQEEQAQAEAERIQREENLKRQQLEHHLKTEENKKLDRFEQLLRQMQNDLSTKEKQLEHHEARERGLEQNLRKTEHTLKSITKRHNQSLAQFQERSSKTDEELTRLRRKSTGNQSMHGMSHDFVQLSARLQTIQGKLNMETKRKESIASKRNQLEIENRDLKKVLHNLEQSMEFLKMDLKRSSKRIEELEQISSHQVEESGRKSAYYRLREELQQTKRELHSVRETQMLNQSHSRSTLDKDYAELQKQWIKQNHLLAQLKHSEAFDMYQLRKENKILIFHHEKQKSTVEKLHATVEEQQRMISRLQRHMR